MSNSQVTAESTQSSSIMHWLLATLQVVNAGSKLAPEKAITKVLLELISIYGVEGVWERVKQLSLTFRIADASSTEALFHSHPNLPILLGNDEEYKRALSQWFEDNSARVDQMHRLFCGLGKLVPPSTTSKFADGEAAPEHKEILGKVSKILEKENDDEESSNSN